MSTETVNTPPTHDSGTAPGVGSSDWFDVLDVAGNALHNAQYPLRAMELPPYPAGGTCGIHNLSTALESIVKAQDALRALRDQLSHWTAMNEAYGPSSNTEMTDGYRRPDAPNSPKKRTAVAVRV